MVRRVSSLLLAIGLTAAVVAAAAVSVENVVLDAARVRAAGGAVLATGPVRRELVPRVASEIRTEIPGASALTPAQLTAVATRTLSEPAFVQAFSHALVDVRDRVFGGGHGRVLLDPHGVAAAITQASAGVPALDGPGASSGLAPHVVIDTASAPHLPVVATATRAAGRVALAVAVAALVLAVPTADRPRRALARVARYAVVVGVVQIVVLWLVPRFVLAAFGAWPDVAAALMRAAGERLVLVAIAAVAAGSIVLAVVGRADAATRRRLRDAALDDLRRRTQWSPPPAMPTPRARRSRPRSGV